MTLGFVVIRSWTIITSFAISHRPLLALSHGPLADDSVSRG
jgi:hypothetical protein